MSYPSRKLNNSLSNLAFIAPALLVFIFVVVFPFLKGITYSFTNWDGISKTFNYIGFTNYINIFSDESIVKPILNSVKFTVITVVLNNIVGLLLALALNRGSRLVKILRTIFFMPFIISLVLAAFIWTYIYSDVFYTILNIKSLLGNPDTVIFGISLIGLWRDSGYIMLIYIAGLQVIPEEYYEASRVDGASKLRQFFTITIPMLIPAITINVTLFVGWGLKVFDYVMAATGGGPGRSSETLALYVYNYTFPYNRAGYGQAAAVLMMLGIFIITSLIARFFRSKEVEI